MGQDPTTCSRTQDRHDNVDKEDTKRPTIHCGMGRRSGRDPEPPPWIPREGNSCHEPVKSQPTKGKLKIVPSRTALCSDRGHVEEASQSSLKVFRVFEA